MRVERFQAWDMAQAIAMIKDRLGPDAVILHSRPVRQGFLRRPVLEVIAAVDQDECPLPMSQAGKAQPTQGDLRTIETELSALRESIARLTWEVRSTRLPVLGTGLQIVYSHLLAHGVLEDLAMEAVLAAASELSPAAAEEPETARAWVARHLQGRVLTCPVDHHARAGAIIFLIGPTGVGKTTTLAKLAGRYALGQRWRVVLVGVDTHRVGALAQLQTYGEIMRVPVEVAYTPDELVSLVQAHRDGNLFLVDTPGGSPQDASHLGELHAFVTAVESAQVYLCMSCTTAYPVMEEIVQRFTGFPLDGLILTKADETRRMGAAISLIHRTRLPVAYVTTGQRVPEDIEPAFPQRLTDWVVQGAFNGGDCSQPSAEPQPMKSGQPSAISH